MLDCGATHNLIFEKLVKRLQSSTKETTHCGVILGSRTTIQDKGICEALEVQLKDWTVKDDFLPLELEGVDIILGMQWLHSLGVTVVDWKNLTLTFTGNGKQICIKGDPSLTKAHISLKSMFKTWGEQDKGFQIECRAVEVNDNIKIDCFVANVQSNETNSVHTVLEQYVNIFEWLDKLPPRRNIEHHIPLKKGTDPINVRPYRYSYHHKEEMEKLVGEMLASGVIRLSMSPFSNLVLLVKKKDGS